MEKLTLPAGQYYIGDPCYVISDHNKWMAFLNSCDFFEASVEASIGDDKFWASPTAYGDGVYESNKGGRFPVDAGLIGIVPLSIVEKYYEGDIEKVKQFGEIVEFTEPFEVVFYPRGSAYEPTHVFGVIEIFTDVEDSYDVDDDEDDEDCH